MKRISIAVVLTVLGLILLMLGASYTVLATQAGSRWMLNQVPGLTVSGWQGAVLTEWRAEELQWQQEGMSLHLSNAHMQIRPSCLLRSTLCLDTLEVERIALVLPPTETADEPEQALELPDLQLPLQIEVQRLSVGEFILNGESLVTAAGLRARWLADGIHIAELGLSHQEYSVQVKGNIVPQADWPLQLQVAAQIPIPDEPNLTVQAQLSGSLHTLTLNAQTTGYLAATLKGEAQVLDADLPVQLTVNVAEFLAAADLPETLTLADLVVQMQGNMQQGYQVTAEGLLAKTPEKMRLDLAALVNTSGAKLESLRLSASAQEFVALQGALAWQDELQADAQLQWQEFPWHSLLEQDDIPVQLHSLTGHVSYQAGDYQGQLDGALAGPAGPFTLTTAFACDLQQVQLSQLLLEAGQGRLQGTATVGFAEGVEWLADIQASQLNPAYWVAELPGELAGNIHSQGALHDGQLQVEATADIKGKLRDSPTQLQLELHGAQQGQEVALWQLKQANIQFGDNRITATAKVDQALAANLQLELPRLVQLWPGLAGKAEGTVSVAGTLDKPQGQAQLQASGIAYDGNKIGKLQLSSSLLASQQAQISLNAERVWVGDNELGTLHIDGSGTLAAHKGELSLTGPLLQAQLKLSGVLQDHDWLGQLQQLSISSHEQNWALEKATAISYLNTGELTIAAHCLRDKQSSLCAGKQQILPQTKIDYRLLNFPLATLQPWLPSDAQIKGQVNGVFKLELLEKGPIGQILLDAGQGQLRVENDEQPQVFAWQRLRLSSELSASAIKSKFQLKGVDSGNLEVTADIDPLSAKKKLRGNFVIENVDLSALRPFIAEVETVRGVLEGRGTLAGDLLAPYVTGFVQVRDGQLSGGELPVPFEQLQLRADIKGEQLQLKGGWHSGDEGTGRISGSVSWAKQLLVDIDIKGQQLPLQVEPYADIEIAPDLHVSLKDQRLFISGEVAVPKGLITIPQLPEQAVRISPDARVIGQAEPEPAMQVAMDVTVNVGAERLRFSGFGLNADLRGHLQVGDNMAGRGMLELLNGRYRAYGQRLELRRARLLFAGPLSQPFLDIEAVRVTGDVTAGLRLSGPADQPRSEIFSTPAMSQEQALSWLLLGRPLQGGGEDGNVMAQAALALGLMGTAPITSKIAEAFGVQDFSLDSEGSGVTSSVVATGRISERVSLRYGVGVFEPASTLALRYELTKRLYLEAASGLANSLDIFYKRNF